jgi:hypothetical protein
LVNSPASSQNRGDKAKAEKQNWSMLGIESK